MPCRQLGWLKFSGMRRQRRRTGCNHFHDKPTDETGN